MPVRKTADEIDELLVRLAGTMETWGGRFPTGAGGMKRGELRWLERKGYVKSRLVRLDSGTLVKMWSNA